MTEQIEDKINDALIKRALGYESEDIVEEYVINDDGKNLTKQKITRKFVPPDISAVKAVLAFFGKELEKEFLAMTDEELVTEKERLEEELKIDNLLPLGNHQISFFKEED